MKRMLPTLCLASLLVGCSEKTTASLEVFKQRAENQLATAAGEAEVAVQLYRNQYAALKERLVRLKTMQHTFSEQLDEAYAAADQRRIELIELRLKDLNTKIPEAENNLREFYDIFQQQRKELQYLKEEVAVYQAAGSLSEDLGVTSGYEHRADTIKQLTTSLKERAKRAQSLLEVGRFEEKHIKQ